MSIISKIIRKPKDELGWLRLIMTIIFVFIITILAWQSDDAYHGYVMAKHLVEGNGFVYNIGQRASATTGPLYTLIIAFAYFITREMFFTSILVNVIFSTAAFIIVVYKFAKTKEQILSSSVAILGSSAFISYTTSGLENCILFFFAVWFFKVYTDHEKFSSGHMIKLALIFSGITMARMDAALLLVPMIVYVFLMKRKDVSFPFACILGFLGLLPFIMWEIFSLIYFGFPVPNTAYVKLGTAISKIEYIKKGLWYIYYTALNDLMVLLIPLVFIIFAIIVKKWKILHTAIGVLLYGLYVIYIGGDFMMGRHFTVMFLISIAGILYVINEPVKNNYHLSKKFRNVFSYSVLAGAIFAATFAPAIGKQFLVNGSFAPGAAISDERDYYSPTTGLLSNIMSLAKNGRMCIEDTWNYNSVNEIRENGWLGNITENSAGILVYYNSDIYLNDTYCLGDPFLSKLPAIKQETWRIGHLRRAVPDGYHETVMYGENVIVEEGLHQYYDIIKEITEGPIFSGERLQKVINWNLGKYEYLLDNYKKSINN